jgi:putative FmdB family regulatory protein
MPFYEYQCKQCGHELEAMQKVNDAPLKKCPECGKSALTRLMSAPVFRLKGAGWYETDFKSDDEGKRNLADKPEPDTPKDEKTDDKKDDKKDTKETVGDAAATTPAPKPVEKSENPTPKKAGGSMQTKPRVVTKPKAPSGAKAAAKRPTPKAKTKKTAKRARR